MHNKILLLFISLGLTFSSTSIHALQDKKQTSNSSKVTHYLLKYGQNPYIPAINAAIDAKDKKAIEVLVKAGSDLNQRSLPKKYIREFPVNKQTSTRKKVTITGKSTVSNEGQTPLEMAIERKDMYLIELLLKHSADPHLMRNVTVYIESLKGNDPQYNLPVIAKGDFVEHRCNSIYETIRQGNVEILSLLIKYGANINEPCLNYSGRSPITYTPIQISMQYSQNPKYKHKHMKHIIDFLISHGAKF